MPSIYKKKFKRISKSSYQIFFTFKEITKLLLRLDRRFLAIVLILNSIWGFIGIPSLYLEKLIIDRLVANIGNPAIELALTSVAYLIFLRVTLEFLRSVISRVARFLSRKLSRYFNAELSLLMAEKMSQLDIATLESPEFKDRFSKVDREASQRAWGMMFTIALIPNDLVGFISSVVVILTLNPLIALGVFLFSLPQFFVDSRYIKREYELITSLSPLRRVWGWLEYYLVRNRDFMEIKILNLAPFLSSKLKSVQSEILTKEISLNKNRELSNVGSVIPLTIFDFGVSIWLALLIIIRQITLGSFQLYIGALRKAEDNLGGLVTSLLDIYENYVFVSDLVWFLNLEPKVKDEGTEQVNKQSPLSFNNVYFKYRKDTKYILKDVSFTINPGERIAIVGENGAGKSTLIKLIARFYDPNKGTVMFGEHDLTKYKTESWRENLAILFQRFESYPFSARESIGYGDIRRVDDFEEIVDSAKKTGINEFIENLPLKYENPLAPEFKDGVLPSVGQMQRLGISRMFFRKNANILIMDEPTSNVDPEAEEKIFKELTSKIEEKILIFVTQRFSTVRLADRIFVLDNGKIIEQGTHRDLMKKKGKYFRLFNLQAQGYK